MTAERTGNLRTIRTKRRKLISNYPSLWKRMISDWRAPRVNNAVWLTYSANYLFNTGGLKWAVDPFLPSGRVPEAPIPDVARDLADLDFALLTHTHVDHLDVVLWSKLKDSRCRLIAPDHTMDVLARNVSVGKSIPAVPGKEIILPDVRIIPFESPHSELLATGERNLVDSTGYLVEKKGISYLFPGDIRTYDPSCIGSFPDVSVVFAHVFLGRSSALLSDPPLLDSFVDFYLSCRPKKIVLSHLYEFGRAPEDCWLLSHARTVAKAFRAADSKIKILIPEWYKETIL